MKLFGKKPKPSEDVVVFPRSGQDPIVFQLKSVQNTEEFETICPRPTPGMIMKPGGEKEEDVSNPTFQNQLKDWNRKATFWMFLWCIKETPGLEWEKVKYTDPETWQFYREELGEILLKAEVSYLENKVWDILGVNEEKLEEAKKRFLASQAEEQPAVQ